ncbi:MAG: hypothetical protein NW226_01165 [Microscillaceae bacterium]|nr:hypothetical protein [Microscillaceae bacterium]
MKKSICLVLLLFSVAFCYGQARQTYKGTINKTLSIEMEIVMSPQGDGTMYISGGYFYTKNPNGGSLNIEGTYKSENDEVNMTEKNDKGVITGYFKGKYVGDGTVIVGKWLSADKKKSYDFELKFVQ